MQLTVDVSLFDVLNELSDNDLIEELEHRGYHVVDDLSEADTDTLVDELSKRGLTTVDKLKIEKLYYAIQSGDGEHVHRLLREVVQDTIGRIL